MIRLFVVSLLSTFLLTFLLRPHFQPPPPHNNSVSSSEATFGLIKVGILGKSVFNSNADLSRRGYHFEALVPAE
ncbi:hypothetical protein EV421DRAFT_1821879 [Armillaria borealis]|uniref:Uncharacterized protein n=1 Tax=Armillaria borealis TaxID=47425 RepID=A0AA39JEN6_9AGAR|nr:hypothetical protein EV421DRAFT_1821879 [Armillaria borealis]